LLPPVECAADLDHLIVEVDVPPAQAQEFALPESTEDRRGKDRSVAGSRSVEQAADLISVEDRPLLPPNSRPLGAIKLADRIDLDQASTRRVGEQAGKGGQTAWIVVPA
jgi:hypothetical protein